MGNSAKPPRRIVVVLKLPEYDVPLLVARATSIVERMTGNPWFPSPLPPLAVVQPAIDDLFHAHTSTLSRQKGTVVARDEKRAILKSRLEQLRAYVEAIATAHLESSASIVESAGMYLKAPGGPSRRVSRRSQGGPRGRWTSSRRTRGTPRATSFSTASTAG